MLQNIPKEKIIEILNRGPTVPAKIAKELATGGNTVLIGAILSTLISSGEVSISHLKLGGSPLYYIPGQESKLESFLNQLNDKDRRVFKLLKDSKVLQDSLQEPLTRVALRSIKDFAKSFELDFESNNKILFWRIYDLDIDEAEKLAKNIVKIVPKVSESIPVPIQAPEIVHIHKEQDVESPVELPNVESTTPKKHSEHVVKSEPIHESNSDNVVSTILNSDTTANTEHPHHKTHHSTTHATHTTHAVKVPKVKKAPDQKTLKSSNKDFFELIKSHILSKNLDIISKEKIKKTEYDLVLKNHDNNEYIYCKAKDKSAISEGDLAPAAIYAQSKKMPCLFIATGDLTKGAESMLKNHMAGIIFEKILITNLNNNIDNIEKVGE